MKWCFCLSFFILVTLTTNAQSTIKDTAFRIVGYYSLNYAMKTSHQKFPFDKLTHEYLLFLKP